MAAALPDERIDTTARYELVFATGPYWARRAAASAGPRIVDEIVVRFAMPDADGRYHMPVIISPNSHAGWWSS